MINRQVVNLLVVVITFALLGTLAGQYAPKAIDFVSEKLSSDDYLYLTEDDVLQAQFTQYTPDHLSWEKLMPQHEKQILDFYQNAPVADITEQIERSIAASNDVDYQSALMSTNINTEVLEKPVSIPGFIVPIDIAEDKTVKSFFVVPYFGACLHYPPPPPNQLIYVREDTKMSLINIQQPYLLTGLLKETLYEDLVGTSAYGMALHSIKPFSGTPDDFRQH